MPEEEIRMGVKGLITIASLVSLTVGFMSSYLLGMADVKVLAERVEHLQNAVIEGTSDRYRGADATRDQRRLESLIGNNARQIDDLQQLLRTHAAKANAHHNPPDG